LLCSFFSYRLSVVSYQALVDYTFNHVDYYLKTDTVKGVIYKCLITDNR
jgi:hypothetical protein